MKRYLIAGLLVWVPLGITIWVLHFLLTSLDQVLVVLPERLQPRTLFGFDIPGLGVVIAFLILLFTGIIAANFFGQRLIRAWESVLGRIPFVKSIYSSVKQVSDTLLSSKGNAFRKALLVEFPRPEAGRSRSRPARRPRPSRRSSRATTSASTSRRHPIPRAVIS